MTTPKIDPRPTRPKQLARALGRSVVSTFIIASVAVAVFAIRDGHYRRNELELIVTQNAALFGGIFISLTVWNYWVLRSQSSGVSRPLK
jgi:hypothetical protein